MVVPLLSKRIKADRVVVELKMLTKHLKPTLDRELCVGCGVRLSACPMGAIERGPVGASRKGLTDVPTVLID
ncbi:MAG: hypothetical protein ACTSUQ_13490 [Candidatus Freyarchaeota archaeon]